MSKKKKLPTLMKEVFAKAKDLGMASSCSEFKQPEKVAQALAMRAEGRSWRDIQSATGIRFDALGRLFRDHNETIAKMRLELAPANMQVASMYTELLMQKAQMLAEDEDALAAISPDKLAVTVGIMEDKSLLLSGQATQIVEQRKGASYEDAMAAINAAKAKVAQGKVIDV